MAAIIISKLDLIDDIKQLLMKEYVVCDVCNNTRLTKYIRGFDKCAECSQKKFIERSVWATSYHLLFHEKNLPNRDYWYRNRIIFVETQKLKKMFYRYSEDGGEVFVSCELVLEPSKLQKVCDESGLLLRKNKNNYSVKFQTKEQDISEFDDNFELFRDDYFTQHFSLSRALAFIIKGIRQEWPSSAE